MSLSLALLRLAGAWLLIIQVSSPLQAASECLVSAERLVVAVGYAADTGDDSRFLVNLQVLLEVAFVNESLWQIQRFSGCHKKTRHIDLPQRN